jgi:hypothetical protein
VSGGQGRVTAQIHLHLGRKPPDGPLASFAEHYESRLGQIVFSRYPLETIRARPSIQQANGSRIPGKK